LADASQTLFVVSLCLDIISVGLLPDLDHLRLNLHAKRPQESHYF
jgi:hypothetical protein